MNLLEQEEINMLLDNNNQDGTKYYAHLNSRGFLFKKETADAPPRTFGTRVVEITKADYNEISIGWRMVEGVWVKPEPVHEQAAVQKDPRVVRIEELQKMLDESDYKIIKHLEYEMVNKSTPYHIAYVHDERQSWRDEISELRIQLKSN